MALASLESRSSSGAATERTTDGGSTKSGAKRWLPRQGGGVPPADATPQAPVTPQTEAFRRKYFVDTALTTGAETNGTNPEEDKKREWVQFSDNRREEFTTFLRNFAEQKHEAKGQPGGGDVLKNQPHAAELHKLLSGGTQVGESLNEDALEAKINEILAKPAGWVLTKTLMEQETTLGLFAVGLLAAKEGPKVEDNPQDIHIQAQANERTGKWKSRLRGAVIGAAVGQGVAQGVEHSGVVKEAAAQVVHAARFLAEHASDIPHGPMATTTYLATLGGVAVAEYLGRKGEVDVPKPSSSEELKRNQDAFNSIKSQPDLVAYIKATWKVDVSDFDMDADGKITVVGHGTKANLREVMSGLTKNLASRDGYYEDLGIPPALRDVMPERDIAEGNAFGRNGEKVTQLIQGKYDELNGGRDKWGQAEQRPDGTPNPYFRRAEEGHEQPDVNNMLEDVWGQKPINPDGSFNVWFMRADGTGMPPLPEYKKANVELRERETGKRNRLGRKETIPPPDKWNQPYYLSDGTTLNPFHGRQDARTIPLTGPGGSATDAWVRINASLTESEIRACLRPNATDKSGKVSSDPDFGRDPKDPHHQFKLENISPASLVDAWGQGPMKDGKPNPFFGKMDSRTLPTGNYNLDNFNITDLTDKQGRKVGDPLFGRGEYKRVLWKGKEVEIKIPDIDLTANLSRNTENELIIDPDFWSSSPPADPVDLSLFNPSDLQGRDRNRRYPWDPLFCRADVKIDYPLLSKDNFTIDKWGQVDGTDVTFGIRGPDEIAGLAIEMNMDLYRQARELVLGDLTEELIRKKTDLDPKRSVSTLAAKRKEREPGGRIYEAKKKELSDPKARENLQVTVTVLEDQGKLFPDIKKAKDAQTETDRKIADALSSYPAGTTPEDAIQQIVRERSGAAPGGASIEKDIRENEFKKATEIAGVYDTYPIKKGEDPDVYTRRIAPLLRVIDSKYEAIMRTSFKRQSELLQQQGDIESLVLERKAAEEKVKDLEEQETAFAKAYAEIRLWVSENDLRNKPITELLEMINTLNDSDATRGWPKESNNERELRDRLWRAKVEAQAYELDTSTIPYTIISTPTAVTREQAIRHNLTLQNRDLEAFDKGSREITFEQDVVVLDITTELIKPVSQNRIYGSTVVLLSESGKYFQIVEAAQRGKTVSELVTDGARLTDAEKAVAVDTPAAYLEFLNLLFQYQNRSDREDYFKKINEVLPPKELFGSMRDVLVGSTSIPATEYDTDLKLIYTLQKNKNLISRITVRQMFKSIIDDLEEKALAMP